MSTKFVERLTLKDLYLSLQDINMQSLDDLGLKHVKVLEGHRIAVDDVSQKDENNEYCKFIMSDFQVKRMANLEYSYSINEYWQAFMLKKFGKEYAKELAQYLKENYGTKDQCLIYYNIKMQQELFKVSTSSQIAIYNKAIHSLTYDENGKLKDENKNEGYYRNELNKTVGAYIKERQQNVEHTKTK